MDTSLHHGSVDVLLTYPSDGLRIFQSMIPIGLVSIGTVVKRAGYRVAIIDFNHYHNDFRRQLQILAPKVIGIGGTTPSRRGSFLTAKIAKSILPNVPVVYGGVNATFIANQVLESVQEIDYVLQGEGELSFLALCDILTNRSTESLSSISGLVRRTPLGILSNKAARINDLDCLPVPERELLPDNYSLKMEFIGGEGDFIMTSRGCPAACNFCSASRMFPGGVRLRSMESVMTEVEYLLTRKKCTGLKLFDSTFTANREHVEQFCRSIKEFNIPWECEIRADTVDKSLLTYMKQSGCYYINMGMETSHERLLKNIAKGISTTQVLDVLTLCTSLGIRSKVFFTFGHVGETFAECIQDISFIERYRNNIDFFAVTVGMRVYPGTRLEKTCKEAGVLKQTFSWMKKTRSLKNLCVLEPGDVPIVFQKQLGPLRLMVILGILFIKRLVCTETFLLRMIIENVKGVVRQTKQNATYTRHRWERLVGIGLGTRVYEGIVLASEDEKMKV